MPLNSSNINTIPIVKQIIGITSFTLIKQSLISTIINGLTMNLTKERQCTFCTHITITLFGNTIIIKQRKEEIFSTFNAFLQLLTILHTRYLFYGRWRIGLTQSIDNIISLYIAASTFFRVINSSTSRLITCIVWGEVCTLSCSQSTMRQTLITSINICEGIAVLKVNWLFFADPGIINNEMVIITLSTVFGMCVCVFLAQFRTASIITTTKFKIVITITLNTLKTITNKSVSNAIFNNRNRITSKHIVY